MIPSICSIILRRLLNQHYRGFFGIAKKFIEIGPENRSLSCWEFDFLKILFSDIFFAHFFSTSYFFEFGFSEWFIYIELLIFIRQLLIFVKTLIEAYFSTFSPPFPNILWEKSRRWHIYRPDTAYYLVYFEVG